MSRDELRTRLRQEFFKLSDEIRHRAGFRPVDEPVLSESAPAAQFFFPPEKVPELVRILRERLPAETAAILRQADSICAHRFDVLGYEKVDFGDPIDWHLDPVHGIRAPRSVAFRVPFLEFGKVGDHKIIWELNRHQHLVTLAKAWLVANDDRYVNELVAQWRQWQQQNPYPVGINWASSLEVGFRSLSWLWIVRLLEGCRVLPEDFRQELISGIGRHARYIERFLSTYFAPNTHLLGEAVALFLVGTLCPRFVSAPRWRQRGWEIIVTESQRQVRRDGLHFEQSVYYHVYALDFFLHARILAARAGMEIPDEFDETVERMAEGLCAMSQAGLPPRFGDDDGGRVFDPRRNRTEHLLDPLCTAAVLYDRSDFKAVGGGLREETVWLLGTKGVNRFDQLAAASTQPASRAFEESGVYVMSSGEPVPRQIVVDAGPFGAFSGGHGHADALSVQLIAGGRHWLTDPGTCCYPTELPERNQFRGTAAHNTVRIDNRDQAEPSGPFSWNSLPDCHVDRWISGDTLDLFIGSHDGYGRLPDPVTHRRWIVSWKCGGFLVRDVLTGRGSHDVDQFWHLDPAFRLVTLQDNLAVFGGPGGEALLFATAKGEDCTSEILEGHWSSAYGHRSTGLVMRHGRRAELPVEFCTSLIPIFREDSCLYAQLERVSSSSGVSAYRSGDAYATRLVLFSEAASSWAWQDWRSDAEFISCSDMAGSDIRQLHFVGGSHLEVAGRDVLKCSGRIDWWECRISPGEATIVSGDDSLVRHFDGEPLHEFPLLFRERST